MGIYPTYVEALSEGIQRDLKLIKENKDKIRAIGEIGLDYHNTSDESLIKIRKMFSHHSRATEQTQ